MRGLRELGTSPDHRWIVCAPGPGRLADPPSGWKRAAVESKEVPRPPSLRSESLASMLVWSWSIVCTVGWWSPGAGPSLNPLNGS